MAKSSTATKSSENDSSDVGTSSWSTSADQSGRSNGNGNGHSGQPPELTFRVVRVSASVFINTVQQQGSNGEYTRRFRTCTIQRSYKTEDGATKYVSSFGLGEIRNAIRVLELAAEHLESKEARIAD